MYRLAAGLPKSNRRNLTNGLASFPSKLVPSSPINHSGCSIVSGVPTTARSGSNQRRNFMPFAWTASLIGLKSIWMRNFIDSPVSRMQKPVLPAEYLEFLHFTIRAIPSGIHPEGFIPDVFLRDLIEKTKARRCLHPAPSQVRHRQNDGLPVVLGRVVFQDMPPQNIVGIDIVPFPRQQQDLRSANLLARMEREMRPLHAGSDSNRCLRRTRKRNGPCYQAIRRRRSRRRPCV